ncbi:MAG: hypothetical protein M2R45_01039 [Verrucomicrobia subdivision 3 bacterium]|nr:hypothetical protein [Limisphaerales bacterium]MCS1414151.1 hypothetical protein [Limisphaerales bacterium]
MCALLAVWVIPMSVEAVIFLGTDDPDHNTTAPDGELAGSGWQYLGKWGVFLGTVIGPHHFITARHVGGTIGEAFHYHGKRYVATAYYEVGSADLRIWEVCELFPEPYAPLYPSGDEEGKKLVVFGRGTRRGEEVWLDTRQGREHRGWLLGGSDNRWRWGENIVTTIKDISESDEEFLPGELQYLVADFDRDGDADEAHLSAGDSGGAVFIKSEGRWALAGVNFGTEGPFNTIPDGDGFFGALFDVGGFYVEHNDEWVYLRDRQKDIASAFFATRISNYLDGIQDVLNGVAEPEARQPAVWFSRELGGQYEPEVNQETRESSQTIVLPLGEGMRFYRLVGCVEYVVEDFTLQGETLILHYRLR